MKRYNKKEQNNQLLINKKPFAIELDSTCNRKNLYHNHNYKFKRSIDNYRISFDLSDLKWLIPYKKHLSIEFNESINSQKSHYTKDFSANKNMVFDNTCINGNISLIDTIKKNTYISTMSNNQIIDCIRSFFDRAEELSEDEGHQLKSYIMAHLIWFTSGILEEMGINTNSWHIWLIVEHLVDFYFKAKFRIQNSKNTIAKLAANLAPRSHKSLILTNIFTAWLLTIDPTDQIIVISCNMKLANCINKRCKDVFNRNFYKENFSENITIKYHKNNIYTSENGNIITTSINSGAIGQGANIIIVDDPHNYNQLSQRRLKSAIEHFKYSTYSRIERSRNKCKSPGGLMVVMQRLTQLDLMSHVNERICEWDVLRKSLIQEEDHIIELFGCYIQLKIGDIMNPTDNLHNLIMETRDNIGITAFNIQFQQKVDEDNEIIIKSEDIRRYDYELWKEKYNKWKQRIDIEKYSEMRIIHSVDTASSADRNNYSVCATWCKEGDNFYLLEVVRKQVNYPNLLKMVLDQCTYYPDSDLIIESNIGSAPLIAQLRENDLYVYERYASASKTNRLKATLPFFEKGLIHLPDVNSLRKDDQYTKNWLREFEYELFSFPSRTVNDDQVDTIAHLLLWAFDNYFKERGKRYIYAL